jgi:hypothetical protein
MSAIASCYHPQFHCSAQAGSQIVFQESLTAVTLGHHKRGQDLGNQLLQALIVAQGMVLQAMVQASRNRD